MYAGVRVGVVVPAHDEEGFVGDVIRTMPAFVDRLIVVDDGSTDGTWAEIHEATRSVNGGANQATVTGEVADSDLVQIRQLTDGGLLAGAEGQTASEGRPAGGDGSRPGSPRGDGAPHDATVLAVRHETNMGRGAAVKTGYRLALADGVDVVAVMDGDGQMDPDILAEIVGPVARGDADYAKGDRLCGPKCWVGMSRFRLFGNVLLTGLTRVASGYWRLRDPQNGYTAIGADALRSIELDELYDGYGFLNDLLVALGAARLRVTSVPMKARYGEETSGIRYTSFVPSLSLLLLRGFLWRVTIASPPAIRAPLVTCYTVGPLAVLLAAAKAAWPQLFGQIAGSATPPSLLVVGVVTLLVGVLIDGWQRVDLQVSRVETDPE